MAPLPVTSHQLGQDFELNHRQKNIKLVKGSRCAQKLRVGIHHLHQYHHIASHGKLLRQSVTRFSSLLNSHFQADKLRTQQELERLQAKFIGTGHPDTTSWEWRTNIHRDTYSSIAGHRPLLSYVALSENEPLTKARAKMIRVGLG